MEAFAGLALRYKIRDYTTFGTYPLHSTIELIDNIHPKGTFHQETSYPMIVVGLKIGFNTFIK